ncbi:ABC transporter ATP-binding protein [Ferrimicrobium acidiphilum]|uniref:Putative multidrug export ATP-binding/permease protein n=1 Tax=Ferrimicrobium acidiphilum DSM 19497 TaxID=1121877 RepID=A0A0D8FXD9_9ACTN|nr:ABC transporter ATP-binding protein [Ferrimicrobium acidiphilum]KJE77639.1 putative multidrug export ATP-binding/permease protein [Ferrimicrobium acidiphilum DSM 19497]
MRGLRNRSSTPVSVKDIDSRTLGRAWQVTKEFRFGITLYLLAILLAALFGSLTPLLFKDLINNAIPRGSVHLLIIYAVILGVLTLAQTGVGVLSRYLQSVIGEGIIYRLRIRLFEHMQTLSLSFFTHSQTGSIISRVNNDVVASQQVVGTLGSLVSDVATLVFTLFFMFELSPQVTILALLIVPVLIALDRLLGKRLTRYARVQMQANAEMSAFEQERFNVSGSLLVSLFGNRSRESEQFRTQAAEVREAGIRFALFGRLYYSTLALMGGIGTVAVYAIGGDEAIHHVLTLGALVALAQYVTKLFAPLTDLSSARVNLLQALVSFDRVYEVLDLTPEVQNPTQPIHLPKPAGQINFEHVSFKYPSATPLASLAKNPVATEPVNNDYALFDVNMTLEQGTMTALVGQSGAGKTTITNLITRLYDPTDGSISFDGVDLRALDIETLRMLIGVVSQDPFLFHDTVRSNLLYANIHATTQELSAAVEASQLAELIERLPQGLDTLVGERGYRLSGGEKQRMSIARVLLKDPKVVVLDEATSSLDSTNEARIQEAIGRTLKGRTSLVIAHRLSTVLDADMIVVLDHGRVAEVGPHRTLIERRGLYAEVFERQFRTPDTASRSDQITQTPE